MNDETQQIFKEQIGKLPSEVVNFISSANWDEDLDEIGSLYNLSPEELSGLHREATLVLAGLVHPDEFGDNLEQEAGIHGAVRDAIVTAVEQRIFAPVRSALVEFLEQEEAEVESPSKVANEEKGTPIAPTETLETKEIKSTAWKSGTAPDNLPIAEAPEYLVPPIPSKTSILESRLKGASPREEESEEEVHPFEEKMKRVFTAGQQAMGDLTLTPTAPQVPTATQPSHSDPYREPIE